LLQFVFYSNATLSTFCWYKQKTRMEMFFCKNVLKRRVSLNSLFYSNHSVAEKWNCLEKDIFLRKRLPSILKNPGWKNASENQNKIVCRAKIKISKLKHFFTKQGVITFILSLSSGCNVCFQYLRKRQWTQKTLPALQKRIGNYWKRHTHKRSIQKKS